MFKWLFETFAPATFTKGVQMYSKGEYDKASKLLKKAVKWMPELKDDGLYFAYDLLITFHLEAEINIDSVNAALKKIKESDLRETVTAKNAERELNSILSQI